MDRSGQQPLRAPSVGTLPGDTLLEDTLPDPKMPPQWQQGLQGRDKEGGGAQGGEHGTAGSSRAATCSVTQEASSDADRGEIQVGWNSWCVGVGCGTGQHREEEEEGPPRSNPSCSRWSLGRELDQAEEVTSISISIFLSVLLALWQPLALCSSSLGCAEGSGVCARVSPC